MDFRQKHFFVQLWDLTVRIVRFCEKHGILRFVAKVAVCLLSWWLNRHNCT